MIDRFIAVIDSGIGGISLLKMLTKELPNKNYIYLGDTVNAPYGNKSVKTLLEISMKNIDALKRYELDAIVLGCNTLSVNLIGDVSAYSGVPVFGVFPPVERAMTAGNKTLLLSTCATAKKYSGCNIDIIGFKNLASDIERHAFSLDKINLENNIINSEGKFVNKKGYYDTIILGCTHYSFIKNKIYDHFCPQKILNGESFTLEKIVPVFKNQKIVVNHYQNKVLFLGEDKKYIEKFYFSSGR